MAYTQFPTRRQWLRFLETRLIGLLPASLNGKVDVQTSCLSCLMPVAVSEAQDIKIGCLVKVTEEEVIPAETVFIAGIAYRMDEQVKLSSKVFPMIKRGMGCMTCSLELLRQSKVTFDNIRVKDPFIVKVPIVTCIYEGQKYRKTNGRWFTEKGIAVPTAMWGVLNQAFSERVVEERVGTSNPGKPTPYIDKTDEVLEM